MRMSPSSINGASSPIVSSTAPAGIIIHSARGLVSLLTTSVTIMHTINAQIAVQKFCAISLG